jgi:formylmethanofuran dehydrogenase subunit C
LSKYTMTLQLDFTGKTTIPVEIEGFTPTLARDKSLDELRRFEIYYGNQKLALAEMFMLAGDPSDGRMEFAGDLSGVHWIGAGMSGGSIHIAGNVGRHLGSDMTGGEIHVSGDAGDWVGGEMQGGFIHVRGSAGHLIGAAYRGSRRGMTGGTILIGGDVGNEIGHTMRRGLLVVGGSAGDCAGFNMIAGSVYIFGSCGIRAGAGMRRGTIGMFGSEPTRVLSTFHRACRYRPQFLPFTFRQLARHGFTIPDKLFTSAVTVYNGDLLELGKGELLLHAEV